MSRSAGIGRFIDGFIGASIALGAIIILVWALVWVQSAFGGQWPTMPMKLLASGGALILLGLTLRFLLTSQGEGKA